MTGQQGVRWTCLVRSYLDNGPDTVIQESPICPDLLDHTDLGVADSLRGRVVRGFFWLMRAWKP